MEFLLAAIVGLMLLGLASLLLVEGGFLIVRTYGRLSYWLRYRYPSWRSGRQVRALKRRYGSTRDRSRPFGALRFTKSRAEEFSGPPEPPAGS